MFFLLINFGIYFDYIGKAMREAEANIRRQRRLIRTQMLKHMTISARVVRGVDWKWRNQDSATDSLPGEGTITSGVRKSLSNNSMIL